MTTPGPLIVGAHLRHLRTTRGLRLHHIAHHAGISPATLSRLETGTIHTHHTHLPTLLHLYLRHHELDHLNAILDSPPDTWTNDHTTERHTHLTACHQQATTHRHYTSHHIPHPLRTPTYHEALTPHTPPPPSRWPTAELFLDEAVLHRTRTVPPHILTHQLSALHHAARRGKLRLRIVPLDTHTPIPVTNLTELTLPKGQRLHITETATAIHYATQGPPAHTTDHWFHHLHTTALSLDHSLDHLTTVLARRVDRPPAEAGPEAGR